MTPRTHLVVAAKAPVPGKVKTRLCPPCTPEQAAGVAAAALHDTLAVGDAAGCAQRTLLLHGEHPTPPGWRVVTQRGEGLGARLANGFADTAGAHPTVLIGMDTPQVTVRLLAMVRAALADADAVLAPACDGGWWALALRDPHDARVLADVPMSTPHTGEATAAALRALRPAYRLRLGPRLRDVDTAADAWRLATANPHSHFAATVRTLVPRSAATA